MWVRPSGTVGGSRSTVGRRLRQIATLIVGAVVPPAAAPAQSTPTSSVPSLSPPALLGTDVDERLRLDQLTGHASVAGFLLRSASSLADSVPEGDRVLRLRVISPQLLYVQNSDLPFSLNDGSLWAGRGWNVRVSQGFQLDAGRVRLIVMPELVFAENRDYAAWSHRTTHPPPPHRSPYSSPWGVAPGSIDLPLRFGDEPATGFFWGQSSVTIDAGALELGASTENNWWGPGTRNALLLSNNAPGFPHLFLRSGDPIETAVGAFEGRWLIGVLAESRYFDTVSFNGYNSISTLALTWQPKWERGLTVGIARAVFAPTRSADHAVSEFHQVFANIGRPNALPDSDSSQTPGRDQIFSMFGRWVFPEDRFETYFEWARHEQPVSLRDLLTAPNHTRGYTLGLQWLSNHVGPGRIRLQAEITNVERSSTYRERPVGSWYTSRAVLQGYTHRGQVLGAAIGPGGTSQWLALDYIAPAWRLGAYAGRIRWNNDAWATQLWERGAPFCKHDVSLLPGARGAVSGRFGAMTAEFTAGNRLNAFFKNFGDCFTEETVDVRNQTLTFTFSPAAVAF